MTLIVRCCTMQDDDEPYWWPAVLVPDDEMDASMPTPGAGQCVARYFTGMRSPLPRRPRWFCHH
jgi:hypothetical protein